MFDLCYTQTQPCALHGIQTILAIFPLPLPGVGFTLHLEIIGRMFDHCATWAKPCVLQGVQTILAIFSLPCPLAGFRPIIFRS